MKTAIIAHTCEAKRQEWLSRLLRSIGVHPALEGWRVCLVAQGYARADMLYGLRGASQLHDVMVTPHLLGAHNARRAGMLRWPSEAWVMLDDDMELLSDTTYTRALEEALLPGVGLVQTGHARSVREVERLKRKASVSFTPSPLICTGGGLVLGPQAGEAILTLGERSPVSDNLLWSLGTYLQGFTNGMLFDSWALHWAGREGGHKAYLQRAERENPSPEHVTLRYQARTKWVAQLAPSNQYLWPESRDLTAKAHEEHRLARSVRGWL